uniref:Uncharacterized protein n=1 Tax=Panagrolaimus davidi TaxID=227884 RepID=A0A914PAY3_9BILA
MTGSKYEIIDLETVSKNIWISDHFHIHGENSLIAYCFPKIIVVDIYYLILAQQSITFEQFTFLGKKVRFLELEDTFIKNANGEDISLEDILNAVPFIEDFTL